MATRTVQYLADKRILHIKTSGTYTTEDSKEVLADIAAMQLEPEQVAILVDHRDTKVDLSLSEIYGLPKNYQAIVGAPLFTVALVFKQIGLPERFYRAVCAAAGFSGIEIFSDCAQAEAWIDFRQRMVPG